VFVDVIDLAWPKNHLVSATVNAAPQTVSYAEAWTSILHAHGKAPPCWAPVGTHFFLLRNLSHDNELSMHGIQKLALGREAPWDFFLPMS
jgi:hypothetical protein